MARDGFVSVSPPLWSKVSRGQIAIKCSRCSHPPQDEWRSGPNANVVCDQIPSKLMTFSSGLAELHALY